MSVLLVCNPAMDPGLGSRFTNVLKVLGSVQFHFLSAL